MYRTVFDRCGYVQKNHIAVVVEPQFCYDCLFVNNQGLHLGFADLKTTAYNCTFINNRDNGSKGILETSVENQNCILIGNVYYDSNNSSTIVYAYNNLRNCIYDNNLGSGSYTSTCVPYEGKVVFSMAPNGYECVPVKEVYNQAIDLGNDYAGVDDPTTLLATDLLGKPRKVGAHVDAGCCEAQEIDVADAYDLANGSATTEATFRPAASDHPAMTVTDKSGNTLVEGVDYRVEAIATGSGDEFYATAVGLGVYHGSISATFTREGKVFYVKKGGSSTADCLTWETAGTLKRAVALASDPANGGESWDNPAEIIIEAGTKENPITYDVSVLGSEWRDLTAVGNGTVSDYVYVHTSTDDREGTVFTCNSPVTKTNYWLLKTTAEWKVGGFTIDGWSVNIGYSVLMGSNVSASGDGATGYTNFGLIVTNMVMSNFHTGDSYILGLRIFDVIINNGSKDTDYKYDRSGLIGVSSFSGNDVANAKYGKCEIDGLTITNCTTYNSIAFVGTVPNGGYINNLVVADTDFSSGSGDSKKSIIYGDSSNTSSGLACSNWWVKADVTGLMHIVYREPCIFKDSRFEAPCSDAMLNAVSFNGANFSNAFPEQEIGFYNCTFGAQGTSEAKRSAKLLDVSDGVAAPTFSIVGSRFENWDFKKYNLVKTSYNDASKKQTINLEGNTFVNCDFETYAMYHDRTTNGSGVKYPGISLRVVDNEFTDCTFAAGSYHAAEASGGFLWQGDVFTRCTFAGKAFRSGHGTWRPGRLNSDTTTNPFDFGPSTGEYCAAYLLDGCKFLGCTVNANATMTRDSGVTNGTVFDVNCDLNDGKGGASGRGSTNTMSRVRNCVFSGNNYTVANSCGFIARALFESCTFENESLAGSAGDRGLLNFSSAYNCTFKNCGVAAANAVSAQTQSVLVKGGNKGNFLDSCRIIHCTGGLVDNAIIHNCLVANNTSPVAIWKCRVTSSTVVNNTGTGINNDNGASYPVYSSIVYGNGTNLANVKTQNHNLVGSGDTNNPKFIDAENGNYTIAEDSPARDNGDKAEVDNLLATCDVWMLPAADGTSTKGKPYTAKPYDLNFAPRVIGSAMDIGAFEYTGEPDIDLATCSVAFTPESPTPYTGKKVNVAYVVSSPGGDTLREGIHFTAEWSRTPIQALGTYTLTLTALPGSGYTGTLTAKFTVGEADVVTDADGNSFASLADAIKNGRAPFTLIHNARLNPDDVGAGEWTVYASGFELTIGESSNFRATYEDDTLTIVELIQLSDCEVTFKPASPVFYTGSPIAVIFVVTDTNGVTLVENTHFTAAWDKDLIQDAGDYTLTLTAVEGSDYGGTTTAVFTVVPLIDLAGCTVTFTPASPTEATGGEIEVAYVVTAPDGQTVLEKGTHYTAAWDKDPIQEVGDYTLTLTAKAGSVYTGTKTAVFTVIPPTQVTDASGNRFASLADAINNGTAPFTLVKDASLDPADVGVGEWTVFANGNDLTLVPNERYTATYANDVLTIVKVLRGIAIRPDATLKAKLGGETLEDFPILVRLSEEIDGFDYDDVMTGGADIKFYDDDDNRIPYEIELWDPTGVSYIWVKVPALDADTVIYLDYDGKTTDNDPTEVWSKYALVLHGNEFANAAGAAVTVQNGGGVTIPAEATGIIGKCFDKTNKSAIGVQFSNLATMNPAVLTDVKRYTMSGWYNFADENAAEIMMCDSGSWSTCATMAIITHQSTLNCFSVASGSHQPPERSGVEYYPTKDTWGYYAFSYDRNTAAKALRIYYGVDNNDYITLEYSTDNALINRSYPASTWWAFGSYADVTESGNTYGKMDELRIYDGIASRSWLDAEYSVAKGECFEYEKLGGDINLDKCTVEFTPASPVVYTGSPIAVACTVTDPNGVTLVENTHFTAAWDKTPIRNAGDYTLTLTAVSGSGYTGTTEATFTVAKRANAITGVPVQANWKEGEEPVPADLTGVSATYGTPVAVYYLDADCTTEFTPSAATPKGTYYVRAEVAETDTYDGALSAAVSFKVKGDFVEVTYDVTQMMRAQANPTNVVTDAYGEHIISIYDGTTDPWTLAPNGTGNYSQNLITYTTGSYQSW